MHCWKKLVFIVLLGLFPCYSAQPEKLTSMSEKKHAEQMNALSQLIALINDQWTMELEELRETVKEQLSEQLQIILQDAIGDLLQRQAVEQASLINEIMGEMGAGDREQKETFESWMARQEDKGSVRYRVRDDAKYAGIGGFEILGGGHDGRIHRVPREPRQVR
jgi:hypothetical protein